MATAAGYLIGLGVPAGQANAIGNTVQTLAGVGTAQTGAKAVQVNLALLTTTGGATAFIVSDAVPIGGQVTMFNSSSTTALIYPPVGGAFDGGSTNASVSLVQNAGLTFTRLSTTSWRTGGAVAGTFTTGSFSGAVTAASLAVTGAITSSGPTGGGIGYATGAGGAVTQITNRTTGVTLSTLTGQITTNNASLAAETAAEFTVTNTTVAIGDVVVVAIQSGTNGGNTEVFVSTVAAGSFKLKTSNNNAAAGTAETGAIIINYAVIKAVAA